jgi:hypothetical protein
LSSKSAKHRKKKRASAQPSASARHRKPSPVASALQNHPTRTAAAVTGAVLIAAAAPAATHWSGSTGVGQAAVIGHSGDRAGLGTKGSPSASGRPSHVTRAHGSAHPAASGSSAASHPDRAPTAAPRRPRHAKHVAAPQVYANPLRAITGLVPERIDQGVDFGGAGPIYAIGDAIVTNAQGNNYGWPGGGWITYRLTDGPAAGLTVFVAENVTPTVTVGQQVTSSTVVANMYVGGAGIETGWAMASGFTAESQLPEAGGISGAGPFPTDVGLNFEELLQALGVPAANNRYDYPSGILPSTYPSDWTTALHQ